MEKQSRAHEDRLIVRVDNSASKRSPLIQGYSVRIYRGVKFSRFFSDSVHGGKKKALLAARKVRDEMEVKIPLTRKPGRTTPDVTRNTSPSPGIRPRTIKIARGSKTRVYMLVEASWKTADGRVLKRNFSVDDLGLMEAWKQAIACRAAGAGESLTMPQELATGGNVSVPWANLLGVA